ncbi:MAG: amidohydrolase family protein [Verrucomicrobiota bacterium]
MIAWTCICFAVAVSGQEFDLVIRDGRVMDPESGLDAVRNVGIHQGKVQAISSEVLRGKASINAAGLAVAPGFIDLHQHAQDEESYRFKVMDGVTTACELEVGTADVDRWYAEREGKLPINFGVSIGHIQVRMTVMGDQPSFLPGAKSDTATREATPGQIKELQQKIEHGLKRGAIAVGFGIAYTPAATHWEVLEMFRVAARHRAPCHVHIRYKGEKEPGSSVQALQELIAAALVTSAPLHVVHVQSSGGPSTPRLLELIGQARARGLDITTECYPYTAGMTDIRSAIFDEGWQERSGIDFKDLQWGATGERLTAESFARYRKTGGLVIVHSNPESVVRDAVANPLTMIASDGLKGHPRNAGTYARVLGHYVREAKALTLMEALRKVSLMPAQRLEQRTPAMKNKGRLRAGADADIVVFDANAIKDLATFEQADRFSTGIHHVLVNGVPVVSDGKLREGVLPGKAVRAAVQTN